MWPGVANRPTPAFSPGRSPAKLKFVNLQCELNPALICIAVNIGSSRYHPFIVGRSTFNSNVSGYLFMHSVPALY